MLNRQEPPPFKTINRIDVQRAQHNKLSNGIDLYTLSAGSQEITRIELIFRAGMYHQPATLIASCTNTLLESGTQSYTANEISEGIDYFGSFLELQADQDYATVTIYALNKYLEDSLKFVAEMVRVPVFPEDEFKIHVTNKRQKHAINSQKVNVVAKRRFVALLFGEKHPYGVDVQDKDFDRVSVAELKDFFRKRYNHKNCTIIAAGALPKNLQSVLDRYFGNDAWGGPLEETTKGGMAQTDNKRVHLVEKDDAIQSAIRVGRLLFNKTHEDYFSFQVLNTILGGYFGSRLMANIREDKGYTYGIGSGVTNLVNNGYFYISTEVGVDVTTNTLKEIYHEINRLRNDLVSAEELETVRNYMLGNFLRSVDGPFSLGEKFRAIWEYGLDYSYFDKYFETVKSVTPAQLRDLANKYLREQDLLECVVGKKAG
jgi:zinc protease